MALKLWMVESIQIGWLESNWLQISSKAPKTIWVRDMGKSGIQITAPPTTDGCLSSFSPYGT